MNLETVSIPLAAGGQAIVEVGGRRVYVLTAAYTIAEVVLSDANGSAAGYLRNVGEGAYANVPFSSVRITNGGTGQTVRLLIADGDAGSNALPGIVRVVDQSIEKTLANTQGITGAVRQAVAAQNGICGVYLDGTGAAAIKRMQVFSATAGLCTIYAATGLPTSGTSLGAGAPSKLIGSGVRTRVKQASGFSAAAAPTVGELPGNYLLTPIYIPANTFVEVPLTTPLVLPTQNYGVYLVAAAVNVEVRAIFDVEDQA